MNTGAQTTDPTCETCGKPLSQHPHPYIPPGGDRRHTIITGARGAHFSTKDLNPATQLYITVEDRLRVQVYNSLAGVEVDVSARLQLLDGQVIPIRLAFLPTANRANNIYDTDLAEGFLLDLTVSTPTAGCRVGQTFVVVSIIRGYAANAIPSRTIVSNYVNTGNSIGWPEGPNQQSVQGVGVPRSINVSNPAAGSDWSLTVPTGARWLIQSVTANFLASATVANRRIGIWLFDALSNTFFQGSDVAPTTAGQGKSVSAAGGLTNYNTAAATQIGLPDVASYLQGFSIQTVTNAIQVGDLWSSIYVNVIEWLEQ
jgi:hypothetical protein